MPAADPPRIDLTTILGPNLLGPIEQAKTISVHAVGDTGVPVPPSATSSTTSAMASAATTSFMSASGAMTGRSSRSPETTTGAVYGPSTSKPVTHTLAACLRNTKLVT